MTWLTMTIEENYYDMEMVPVKENRVLTLSTCSTGQNEDSRYTVHSVIQEITEDMAAIKQGFELLQYDYLGGNGTRGYGKIKFSDLSAKCVVGNVSADIINQCNEIMKGE